MVRGRLSVGTFLLAALCGCSGNGALGESGDIERGGIVNGATDSNDKSILGIYIEEMALCSGTLIAPNLVLTARHCVAPMNGGENVDCASNTFGTNYPPSGFYFTWYTDIRQAGQPPTNNWVGATEVRTTSDNTFCGNDAALLILDTNIPASTAPVIEPRVNSMPMTPEGFKAIGYGLNSPNDTAGDSAGTRRSLGNLEVGCVGDECSQAGLGTRITAAEWAANAPVCSGDSGGPALDDNGKVIGIASRSDETCALGLYSAVAAFKDLIVGAAKDAADQGGYDTPTWASGGASGSGGTAGMGAGGAGGAAAGKGGSSGSGGAKGGAGGKSTMGGSSNAGTGGSDATGGMTSGNGGRGSAGRAGSAGMSSDAGTAGTTSGNAGTASTVSGPTLGDECTSGCEAPYKCYASTGKPPGECVPACSVTTKCPSAYRCDIELGVCTPMVNQPDSSSDSDSSDSAKDKAGCGCRVTPVSDATGNAWQAFGALGLAVAFARRRRRSTAA